MTLFSLKDALAEAEKEKYAIGAFNLAGEDMLIGILEAAIQEKSAVIVSIAEAHLPYMRLASFINMVRSEAEAAPVPVVIHLDHACRFETIYEAFQLGFTSVMYDGSVLDYNDNILNTQHIAKIAHSLGISVEAELGHVGGTTDEVGVPHDSSIHLTDPSKVPEFVDKTGVDALAVAFGTAHGFYQQQPKLNFDLLADIDNVVDTPLVLHGGTGLSDEAFTTAIRLGVRKINYGTDLFATSVKKAREVLLQDQALINYAAVCVEVRNAVRDKAARYMRLWGSADKSWVNSLVNYSTGF